MKQPHTEQAVQHTDNQQNTGNHPKSSVKQPGPDELGGTRAGADNVEPVDKAENQDAATVKASVSETG